MDPRVIGLSRWANRHAGSYKTEEFAQLRAAIELEGANTQPVYVRPCADAESGRQFEVVSGSRRVRARLPRAHLIQRLQHAVGVGSTNTDGRTPIVIGGEAAGYIQTDVKGKLTMTVQHPMLKGRAPEASKVVQSLLAKLLLDAAPGREPIAPKKPNRSH